MFIPIIGGSPIKFSQKNYLGKEMGKYVGSTMLKVVSTMLNHPKTAMFRYQNRLSLYAPHPANFTTCRLSLCLIAEKWQTSQ